MMYILYDVRRGYVVYDVNHKEIAFFTSEQQAINFIYQNKQLVNNVYYNNQYHSISSLHNNPHLNETNNFTNSSEQMQPKYSNVNNTVGVVNETQSSQFLQETVILNKKLENIQDQINKLIEINSQNNKTSLIKNNNYDKQRVLNNNNENSLQENTDNSFRKYLQKFQNNENEINQQIQKNVGSSINSSASFIKKSTINNNNAPKGFFLNTQVSTSTTQREPRSDAAGVIPFVVNSSDNNKSQSFAVPSNKLSQNLNSFSVIQNNNKTPFMNEENDAKKDYKKLLIISIVVASLVILSIIIGLIFYSINA